MCPVVIRNNVRYTEEDARILGFSAHPVIVDEVPNTGDEAAAQDGETGDGETKDDGDTEGAPGDDGDTTADETERPSNGASKVAWTAYAVAQGKDADAIAGLTRDQIRDLFA